MNGSLTGDEGWAGKPRWSLDGNFIYFLSNRDGFFCLWAKSRCQVETTDWSACAHCTFFREPSLFRERWLCWQDINFRWPRARLH